MKTKKVILFFSIICAVMLININITNNGILKLNVKVGSLKEAQADYPKENNSWLTWSLSGEDEARDDWFGQLTCYKRYGHFSNGVYCSQAPH